MKHNGNGIRNKRTTLLLQGDLRIYGGIFGSGIANINANVSAYTPYHPIYYSGWLATAMLGKLKSKLDETL